TAWEMPQGSSPATSLVVMKTSKRPQQRLAMNGEPGKGTLGAIPQLSSLNLLRQSQSLMRECLVMHTQRPNRPGRNMANGSGMLGKPDDEYHFVARDYQRPGQFRRS